MLNTKYLKELLELTRKTQRVVKLKKWKYNV